MSISKKAYRERCPHRELETGRCLRPFGHSGPHCMVPLQIKNAYPMFWTATQDERSIVYFDSLPSVGSDSQTEDDHEKA